MLEINKPPRGGLIEDLRYLGPVYREKTCPGLKGHSPTRANFSYISFKKLGELIT